MLNHDSFWTLIQFVTLIQLRTLFFRRSESPSNPPQRSLSELELFKQKHNLPEDGEFYTAIGPDGKKSKKHQKRQNHNLRPWMLATLVLIF